jgi:pimeloyl-ACP methyl ester carboxylesterase
VPDLSLPDGRTAHYWLGGADQGPVVLFFHGCPDTRWAARTGEAAARDAGVRLLCVNRQGYGRSSIAASTHASAAADALAVADRLGVGEVAVLGMSVGGAYAAACAATHPGRVTALEVVATMPAPDAAPDESVEDMVRGFAPGFAEWVAGIAPEDADDAALAERFTASLPPEDADLLRAATTTRDLATSVREALATPDGYLRDAALAFRPWEFDPGAITCPTTLRYGDADARAMPGGPWLRDRIPHADLVVVPGATHLATLVAAWPEVLAALLD